MAVAVKQKIRFGPFALDVHSGELYKHDYKLKVQPQPIQVLSILLEHPGELVTREELQKRIWPSHTFVDFEHGLNTAVKKLRQALDDESGTPKYIETLPRRGYRFLAKVDGNHERDLTTTQAGTRTSAASETTSDQLSRARTSRKPVLVLAILIPLVALISVGYSNLSLSPPRIKTTDRLTKTNLQKVPITSGLCSLATDGSRVYFQEHRGLDQWFFSQVSVNGGDTSDVVLPRLSRTCLYGISPSGSELLAVDCCPGRFWSIPLPAGAPRLLDVPVGAHWATWMPDGRSILYSFNGDKDMYRTAMDGSAPVKLLSTEDITVPRISPDGRRIRWTALSLPSTQKGTDIWEADINGNNPHLVFPTMHGQTLLGDWTSDGDLFFFFRNLDNHKTLWAVREKKQLPFFKPKPVQLYAGPLQIESPVAAKSAKEIFVIGAILSGELSVYEPEPRRFVPFLGGISACYVTFSPDKQWIAYVSYPEGALWRSRVDGSERMQLTFQPTGVVNPRWSPDGKFIVYMDSSGTGDRAIYLVSPQGGQPRLLLTGVEQPGDPTWSPDSQSIVYAEGHDFTSGRRINLLDLRTKKIETIPGSQGLWSPRWSHDGRHIVAHDLDWKLMLYDFVTKSWKPLGVTGKMGWEAWSHDSKYVYAYNATNGTIVRFKIEDEKLEVVASLEGTPWTNFGMRTGGWFDLTPDDRIMILRNRGSEEIYKLKLEY